VLEGVVLRSGCILIPFQLEGLARQGTVTCCVLYMLLLCAAVVEVATGDDDDSPLVGVCAVDAAGGQVLLGAWRDDEVRVRGWGKERTDVGG
jgi:hypothetical protein